MSNDLLGRADSLMRRSRTFVAGHTAPGPVDDGIPLLTEEVDLQALIAPPEPPDRTEEITAAVTAEVTQRVTGEVTAAVTEEVTRQVTASVTAAVTERVSAEVSARVTEQVTAEVTERVTAEVTERVARENTAEVTQRVTAEVTAQARDEALQSAQRVTAEALTERFADLAGLIQSLIDDWSTTTLPALVGIEIRAAMEQAVSEAAGKATTRIREQAVLDLRDSIAGEIEARCAAVTDAAVFFKPSEGPDQPL
ncbi:MAG: hypothetical protein KBF58_09135 [Methyloversatilis sp.]|jgi:hypothetical protein|nr:hypothetical protein [Methyloversatilis sp.]MBP6194983.1 hypothetical protein [Methyloversatilis sp.]MBP9118230.1 hypothetical protein [Methyloversatilis sp.]